MQLKNGLGIDIQSTGTLNVNSGNTTLGGNLTVTGTSSLNSHVTVDGDFSVGNGGAFKFTVDPVAQTTSVIGTFTASDNVTLGSSDTDTVTINARVGADLDPTGNGARDLGQSDRKWKDLYLSGTANATTFSGNLTGNVTANSGTSTFNNITVNGIVTGSVTANAGTATQLETARNIGWCIVQWYC